MERNRVDTANLFLSTSLIVVITFSVIQELEIRKLSKLTLDFSTLKCPDTSNPISQTIIDVETKRVTCTYQLPPTSRKGITTK